MDLVDFERDSLTRALERQASADQFRRSGRAADVRQQVSERAQADYQRLAARHDAPHQPLRRPLLEERDGRDDEQHVRETHHEEEADGGQR